MSDKQIIKMVIGVILPPILVIALFIVAIGMFIIPTIEEALLEKKRDTIQAIVASATSIMERHAQMEREGLVSREEAQNTALAEMRALRYGVGNLDYLWITDLEPNMIMHPYFPELEGTNLDDYADPKGKLLFVEAVEIAKNEGKGYISYMWPKQYNKNDSVPKLSYVRLFEPWKWVVGSGIYLDDVQTEIQSVTFRLLVISAWIGGIVILILLFIIRRSWKTQRKIYLFQTELELSRERYQALAHASTEMVFLTIEGSIAGVNKKVCETLGLNEEEIISRDFADFLTDPEDLSLLKKAADTGSFETVETVIQGKYGAERVLLSAEKAVVNEQPAILYAGYALKVKQAPTTNFVSHELINRNGFGILKLENSLGGKVLFADGFAMELLASGADVPIIGKPLKNMIHESDANRLYIQIQATNQAKNIVLRYTQANGNEGYLQANACILKDDLVQGEVILMFISDVTEIQSTQKTLDALLSEYLAPEQKVSPKSKEFLDRISRENIREIFTRDKIILRQSIKIGSSSDKILEASMRSIQNVFDFAVEQAIAEMGTPPCKYALLAYGSIGRHEPTLTADQDTALLFESTGNEYVCREYFEKFGRMVTDICGKAGIPPCNAGNTAANPAWCKSELEWRTQFSNWINTSQPADLVLVNIFFDFSVISGEESLAKTLRQHIFDEVDRKPSFLYNLAQDTLSFRSPADIRGRIRSDSKQGNVVNLKGTMLHYVNFARLFTLKYGIHETNTVKRLQILTKLGHIPSDTGKETIEAWELLSELRLKNQVSSLELNFSEENTVMLEEMSSHQEILLSKAVNQVGNLQKRITSALGM